VSSVISVVNLRLSYFNRSRVERLKGALALMLSPNLARAPVSFDAELAQPIRFREAVSALHDIVISDLRYKPRDHTAYREWLKSEQEAESRLRVAAVAHAREEIEARRAEMPEGFEDEFRHWHGIYWSARRAYGDHLRRTDPALWRTLMPYDPVITVAPDVVFFEGFSADESSYGCLTVDREEFKGASSVQTGTTNVDYSWALYEHFQQLRTYRTTRFHVDPQGFEVRTEGSIREEKIDLPDSWLRGFVQLQAAMTLPNVRVPLDRESVYSILAFLKRRKARKSPRALRFDLQTGRPPVVKLEPWDVEVVSKTTKWDGPARNVRIWGRQRLLVLGRLLPLVEGVDVHLLGDGLPSFWVARMGGMRLTLGLSGWTANDWTRASAVDLLAPAAANPETVRAMAEALAARHRMTMTEFGGAPEVVRGGLYRLARLGQCIQDVAAGVVRWRPVMPPEVAVEKYVPVNEEAAASKSLRANVETLETLPTGLQVVVGTVGDRRVEALLDKDGVFRRAKCGCSHFYKGGLKRGPCRHLLALRAVVWS
jgi:hypothetical protein